MARNGSPARLVIALSIASLLAVFLLYASIAGGGTPTLRPSQLETRTGEVLLTGKVVSQTGNSRAGGLRFRLRDVDGTATVPVVYRGSVPEMFAVGRDIRITGELRRGVFVGKPGSIVTKCPSKYTPKKKA